LQASQLNAITTLPINDQTDDYTLVVGDVGKRVIMNKGTANTVTVDDSIFATGDTIFIANKGAGTSTITAGAGVTINSASGLALVTSQSGQLVALSASSFLFVASDVTATSGVVQVKSTTKSDTFTSASTSFVDVTGVSVSITPTSASNKVLVLVMMNASNDVGSAALQIQLLRDATAIGIGDAAGSRTQATADFNIGSSNSMTSGIVSFLDSPATTSATTYKIQGRNTAAGTFFVNRTEADTNAATTMRGISTITVMEVTP
jgi:hypothetical protein